MFKLVMLNSDMESLKILCNCIINEISDIQLSGMCTSFEEFGYLVDRIKPDIILMNYSDFIHSKYSKKTNFQNFKILFCNSITSTKSSTKQLLISKNAQPNEIIKLIKGFISKQNTVIMRQKVIKMLETFHFDFKLIGTTYLLESILYCYENKTDYLFENLEKNVYPYIAQKCHTKLYNVKWSIVRAINTMNTNISASTQKELSDNLKVYISEKTTAKQLISTLVTKLN